MEDGALVRRSGSAEARWPLDQLTRAELSRLQRGPVRVDYVLALSFGRSRTAVLLPGHAGIAGSRDEAPAFVSFVRALLAQAADAAPEARFARGASQLAAAMLWTAALLAVGAGVTLLFAVSSGTAALGVDLAARQVFALLLLACVWPWMSQARRRGFDPRAVPRDLLPLE